MTTYSVGFLVGSLSSTSINRLLALALTRLAPRANLEFSEVPIRYLPLYSQDFDAAYPPEGTQLKSAIEKSDAIAIVTPEYNRSIPGSLKNAIDWASRPWGTNSLAGKPSAVIGISPGPVGTAVAQQHLRSILSFSASPELAQPEAYLQFREGLIDGDGNISDARTEAFLLGWLNAFHRHIAKTLSVVE